VMFTVTQAVTSYAVGEVYLGRETSVKESLRATMGRWLAYVGISFWQLGSFIWPPFALLIPAGVLIALLSFGHKGGVAAGVFAGILALLAMTLGFVMGVIFLLRNSMGVTVKVIEHLPVRASMRKSKVLAAGAKGRLFLVGLITYCLMIVVGVFQMPLVFLALSALKNGKNAVVVQGASLLIGFIGHSVVIPVALIGITLVYFDQRVRKEAFDVAFLLETAHAGGGVSLEGRAPDASEI